MRNEEVQRATRAPGFLSILISILEESLPTAEKEDYKLHAKCINPELQGFMVFI